MHGTEHGHASLETRIEDVLEGADLYRKTLSWDICEKPRGAEAADEEFDYLAGNQESCEPNPDVRVVRSGDGTTITRYRSERGEPSIQILNAPETPNTKVRYW